MTGHTFFPTRQILAALLFTALPLAIAAPSGAVERTHGDGSISIAQGGGTIDLANAPAGAHLATGGGDIHVGSARVMVRAATGSGSVQIDSVDGTANVATGSGDVKVTLKGSHDVSLASGSGTIVLRLASGVDATFDIETSYSRDHAPVRIRSDFPLNVTESTGFEVRRGNSPRKYVTGSGRTGAGTATIKIRTVNADIRIVKA